MIAIPQNSALGSLKKRLVTLVGMMALLVASSFGALNYHATATPAQAYGGDPNIQAQAGGILVGAGIVTAQPEVILAGLVLIALSGNTN